jgi:hypothetical protein
MTSFKVNVAGHGWTVHFVERDPQSNVAEWECDFRRYDGCLAQVVNVHWEDRTAATMNGDHYTKPVMVDYVEQTITIDRAVRRWERMRMLAAALCAAWRFYTDPAAEGSLAAKLKEYEEGGDLGEAKELEHRAEIATRAAKSLRTLVAEEKAAG